MVIDLKTIEDFYLFESRQEALNYCRNMANVLHRRGDDRVLESGPDKFIEECMCDLKCVVKLEGKKRTNEELEEAKIFLKNCLLSMDRFPNKFTELG